MSDGSLPDNNKREQNKLGFVRESRFGFWFLGTHLWERHVIQITLGDLIKLIDPPLRTYPVILDAGCGHGRAFQLLNSKFNPRQIIGLDAEEKALMRAKRRPTKSSVDVSLLKGDCASIPLADNSIDLIFCHQTFHHLVLQDKAISEFYRVLKAGGLLLFAESTRAYIDTWLIRFLFRHPMQAQCSAEEYIAKIRDAGFAFTSRNILFPYYWWSRTTFAGLLELFRLRRVPSPGSRNETLVYLAAVKSP